MTRLLGRSWVHFPRNIRDLLRRQQPAVDTHFVLRPSIFVLPPPMRHAAAVAAPVEGKIALAILVVSLVAVQLRVWGYIDLERTAGEVAPESTVFVTDGALALVELGRFRRECDLNTAAVAFCNERLDARRVESRAILGWLALC